MLPFQTAGTNAQNPIITWAILGLAFVLMIVFMRRSGQKRVANLTGEETLWDIRAIAKVEDPNFGTVADSDSDSAVEAEADPVAESTPETPDTEPEEPGFGSNMGEDSPSGDDTEKGEGHTY